MDSNEVLNVMHSTSMHGSEVKQVVKDAREKAILIFLDNGVTNFKTTVGPGDCLVVPPDFLWAEELVGHDSMGVKCALFDLRDDAVVKANLEISFKPSTASDSHNTILKKPLILWPRRGSPCPCRWRSSEILKSFVYARKSWCLHNFFT